MTTNQRIYQQTYSATLKDHTECHGPVVKTPVSYSGGSRVQISALTAAILRWFRDFTQSLQANAGIFRLPQNQATTASFHIMSNLSFACQPSIRRCMIWDSEKVSLNKVRT
jgi:hypothetical protein